MEHVPELALDRDALNPPLDTAAKRALIEAELREDAGRSDREIARVVGCDHKTVGSARERLGIAIPLAGNISPSISPPACPPPPGVIDPPKYDPFDPKEGDMVIPHQPAIAVYGNVAGAVVIIQCTSDMDEADPIIMVRPEHVEKLVAKLRQVAKEVLS
jgi:hypothetical protein